MKLFPQYELVCIFINMKIIITELQNKFLEKTLLLELTESNNDHLSYITKYDQKLYSWDDNKFKYGTWQNIPLGTKFNYMVERYVVNGKNYKRESIESWNGELTFSCETNLFYTRGYFFKDKILTNALRQKFCEGKEIKSTFSKIEYAQGIENDLSKVQDLNCLNKIKVPYQNAINWWKNKLDEPSFYSKLKKLNNYTDQQTKDWINKYKSNIDNNISGPFCPKQSSKLYKSYFSREEPKGISPKALAFKSGPAENSRLVFNSHYMKDYDPKNIEATAVHEIQHSLYDLKPMTPDSNWEKIFPYKVWGKNDSYVEEDILSNQEKSTISKYGLKQDVIKLWKEKLKKNTSSKTSDDPGYVCRITELSSRVVKLKNLLNYTTQQKITVDDFKKFIEFKEPPYNDSNAYYLVLCWIYNGMQDIKIFLDNLDRYVVAKVEPKKGDDIKDQLT
jgi:hypothetical protein